jgi:hypothetical protein
MAHRGFVLQTRATPVQICAHMHLYRTTLLPSLPESPSYDHEPRIGLYLSLLWQRLLARRIDASPGAMWRALCLGMACAQYRACPNKVVPAAPWCETAQAIRSASTVLITCAHALSIRPRRCRILALAACNGFDDGEHALWCCTSNACTVYTLPELDDLGFSQLGALEPLTCASSAEGTGNGNGVDNTPAAAPASSQTLSGGNEDGPPAPGSAAQTSASAREGDIAAPGSAAMVAGAGDAARAAALAWLTVLALST